MSATIGCSGTVLTAPKMFGAELRPNVLLGPLPLQNFRIFPFLAS